METITQEAKIVHNDETTTKKMLYESLSKNYYVQVPFILAPNVIAETMAAFFKFITLPAQIKNHIDFTIAPLHRRGDVGYKHRDAQDHIYNDDKEFFHYHPALLHRYPDFLEANPIVKDFVLKAKPIWEKVAEVLKTIFQMFEEDFPGITDKIFATENPHVLLRFLKYDWQSSSKYLAKPHFDAGSFTLAIAESNQGLRIGSNPANLQLIEHKPQNAIFMLASNFEKVMKNTNTNFLPGWHDVIQLEEQWIGRPFARWALVAFIEGHGVEALPRTETHRWVNT